LGAVLLEANDEWQLQHRYIQTEAMAELSPPLIDAAGQQISTMGT
jgi:putative transposase